MGTCIKVTWLLSVDRLQIVQFLTCCDFKPSFFKALVELLWSFVGEAKFNAMKALGN